MLTDDRIRQIARNAGFGGINDGDVELCQVVAAETRREVLEEAIAACERVGELRTDADLVKWATNRCAAAIRALTAPRFANVSCSRCGREFGPGDHGYSHCKDHAHLRALT